MCFLLFFILFSSFFFFFFFSSRRRHTRFDCDWSSDVCSSDLRIHRLDWRRLGFDFLAHGTPGLDAQLDYYARYLAWAAEGDRKSGVEGKRVDLGGRRII